MISHFPSCGATKFCQKFRRDGGDGVAGRHGGVDCTDVGEIREACINVSGDHIHCHEVLDCCIYIYIRYIHIIRLSNMYICSLLV